ncbi:MAG TPA: saccharopine dehydrogenase C-terminal domain-containing protein [Anaerolineales bacterium]|nr:saccharopine dehydrogenase C-terminal domain-containing protein [Anaerolineales bacterium]
MNVLVIGAAGKMGKAVVAYFENDPAVRALGLLDANESVLLPLVKGNAVEKFKLHPVDVNNVGELKRVMEQYDVGVVTLPNRMLSYKVMEAAIEARLDLVDILEEYHRRPDNYQTEGFVIPPECCDSAEYGERLHEKAIRNDVLILDGMGFAPGLSNIATAHGIDLLDSVETAVARVGGIPNIECCAKHPLRYMTTWSLEHVLREYSIKTQILKNGKYTEVHALCDEETFQFNEFGIDEKLECAVTPGMPSFIYTHPELQYFAEKTVRWPGHYQGVRTLLECGLFDETPVDFDGVKISPRKFLLSIINPLLVPQNGDSDVCVMYNTITGKKNNIPQKIEYFMWEKADSKFSAMARVTSFPAAIGAKVVASGNIDLKGIRAPEECILGKIYTWFLEELEKKNIYIKEKLSPSEADAQPVEEIVRLN